MTLDTAPVGGTRHTYCPNPPKVPGNFGTERAVCLTKVGDGRFGMRTRRWLGFVVPLAWVLMLTPAEASADGGAYIELDRTHFLVGSTGHAETYVSVPAGKQHLFERGPFYLYVTPTRSPVTEGRPLPSQAVRVATMTIEHDRSTAFELSASFTVPDLPGDYYELGVCNDPCTISGFREPITAGISIVQTAREAELLNDRQHLVGETYGLKRQIKKLRNENADLERRLSHAGMQESELTATVTRLRGALADARAHEGRAGPGSWLSITIAIALLVGAGGALSIRRHRRAAGVAVGGPDRALRRSIPGSLGSDGSPVHVPARARDAHRGRRRGLGRRMDPVRARSPRRTDAPRRRTGRRDRAHPVDGSTILRRLKYVR